MAVAARPFALDSLEARCLLAAGDLDESFGGGDGVIVYDDLKPTSMMIVLEDGKVLLRQEDRIVRLKESGAIDKGFGEGGWLDVGFDIVGMHVMEDGRIVVGGSAWTAARFHADGRPDKSFGDGGRAQVQREELSTVGAVGLAPDGGILLGGTYDYGDEDFDLSNALTRLTPGGELDTDFADGGFYLGRQNAGDIHFHELAVKPDGTIIGLLQIRQGGHTNYGGYFVLDAEGNETRGDYGGATDDYFGSLLDAVVRPDGTVVITRSEGAWYPADFVTFDDHRVVLSFDPPRAGDEVYETATALTSDRKNRAIVGGMSGGDGTTTDPTVIGLQRFTRQGLPDMTFGFGGSSLIDFGDYASERITSLGATPAGDILVAGSVKDAGADGRLVLARVQGRGHVLGDEAPRAALEEGTALYQNDGERQPGEFTVRYAAEKTIIRKSIDSRDVYVKGPNGFRGDVKLVKSTKIYRGRQHRATYALPAPGGSWDVSDKGLYEVVLRKRAVRDNFGNFATAGVIGTFEVEVFDFSSASSAAGSGAEAQARSMKKLAAAGASSPAAGDLDTGFGGGDGFIVFERDELLPTDDVIVQADGKIVLSQGNELVRLKANGAIDKSFGENGRMDLGFEVYEMQRKPDGKVLVRGSKYAQYNADWTLDETFGIGGYINVPGSALQADGKVLSKGTYETEDREYYAWTLTRYNMDGSVDTSFGDNGVIKSGVTWFDNSIREIQVNAEGIIVIAGQTLAGGHSHFGWYEAFDSTGKPTDAPPLGSAPDGFGGYTHSITRPDGRIVLVQWPQNVTFQQRINIEGVGGGGVDFDVSNPSSVEEVGGLANAPGNKLIVVGNTGTWEGGTGKALGIQKWTRHGLPDMTFGFGGSSVIRLKGHEEQTLTGAAVAPDGDIIAVGRVGDDDDYDNGADDRLVLVRVQGGARELGRQRPKAALEDLWSDVPNSGESDFSFDVRYAAEKTVDRKSIDRNDVYVTGPNGFKTRATVKAVQKIYRGRQISVTYTIAAPGGTWDDADKGTYRVVLRANQVKDNFGNFAKGKVLGTFEHRF